MDYEKKYKEALERAIKFLNKELFAENSECAIKHIFPELAESKDEKVRKTLIRVLNENVGNGIEKYGAKLEDALAWLEKQGEKPFDYESANIQQKDFAPRVEPKFKIGDWIIHHGTENIYQVAAIIDNQYQLKYGDNYTVQNCANVDRCARLWTIQDARNGDVLVNGSNIFIFHFINDTRLMGYCHVNTDDGRFYDDIGKNECFCLIDAVVNPATKEQRDLLFKKMKEAGYEFDFDKKELKKIEQTPTWSEEDEMIALSIEQVMNCASLLNIVPEKIDKIRTWLKSLKDRYTWKPSSKQMEALCFVKKAKILDPEERESLNSLYIHLRKLK